MKTFTQASDDGDFFTRKDGEYIFICDRAKYQGLIDCVENDIDTMDCQPKKKPWLLRALESKTASAIFAIIRASYIVMFYYTLYIAQVGDVITIVICIVGLVYSHIRMMDNIREM